MGNIKQIQVKGTTYDIKDAGAQPSVPGKGLSTNDYTNADKAKLDALPSGADLTATLADKVDKETGKGLSTNDYTDAEKTKLAGIQDGAKDNIFIAEYEVTTFAELNVAFNAGKVLLAKDENECYYLLSYGNNSVYVFTTVNDDLSTNCALRITPNGGWEQFDFYIYSLPSGGIPKEHLASAVQTSLGKADTALQQSDLEPIKEVIPDAATPQNKLADKAFVNSSIATATATFRGAYNLVTDLSLTTAATRAQIATALAGAVSTADNNDYAFVQVPTADVTPTEIAQVERYKYNGSAWAFEYALNNSGFTASQWAALNSGITSGLVGKLSALPTNSELTTLLAGKQDTISDLSTIRTGAAAGATAVQPEAGKGLFSGNYNDLSNKPTIPDAVEANPTVPSGTTPSDLTGLKVGNGYFAVPEGPSDLSDLDDVDGTPTDGQVLTFDGTEGKWTPADPAGGGDDEATEVTAAALNDLNSRMFEKKNLVDAYDQIVPENHKKAPTSHALYKYYRDQLTNEEIIAAAFCQLNALGAMASAIAPLYERGTRTFAVDDCCIHDSQFYRCITAVPTPEPFDPTKWVKTSLFEEMVRRFNAL